MPEGDTVHKVARVLARELVGRTLERVELDGNLFPTLARRTVVDVAAVGKHLLIDLANGVTVRSHLGMHGSWHRYPRGERWRRPRRQASIALWTAEQVAVCFNAKEVECVATSALGGHPVLTRLGPDLLGPDVDFDAVVSRARRLLAPETPVIDLLLDQRVAAGIGNVYKSETLFLDRIHPLTPVGVLEDAAIADLYRTARRLLQANLGGGARATTTAASVSSAALPRLWVYGREQRPCLECGGAITMRRLGRGLRSTYWCPGCQPPVG